jgi:hypothetical protein
MQPSPLPLILKPRLDYQKTMLFWLYREQANFLKVIYFRCDNSGRAKGWVSIHDVLPRVLAL